MFLNPDFFSSQCFLFLRVYYYCITQDDHCGQLYNAARVLTFLFPVSLHFNNARLEIAYSPPYAEAQGSYRCKQTVLAKHCHPLFFSQIG